MQPLNGVLKVATFLTPAPQSYSRQGENQDDIRLLVLHLPRAGELRLASLNLNTQNYMNYDSEGAYE